MNPPIAILGFLAGGLDAPHLAIFAFIGEILLKK
jgi:hypothetical protein